MEPSFVSSANSPNRNPEQRQDKEGCPTPAANPTTEPYPFPSRHVQQAFQPWDQCHTCLALPFAVHSLSTPISPQHTPCHFIFF